MSEEPEHCFACYLLIRRGQTCQMTNDFDVLCVYCALSEGVIRVRDDLAIEVERDRLVIERSEAGVEVFPNEIRHLANALAEVGLGWWISKLRRDRVCTSQPKGKHEQAETAR